MGDIAIRAIAMDNSDKIDDMRGEIEFLRKDVSLIKIQLNNITRLLNKMNEVE